jgi:hypothetical protein
VKRVLLWLLDHLLTLLIIGFAVWAYAHEDKDVARYLILLAVLSEIGYAIGDIQVSLRRIERSKDGDR